MYLAKDILLILLPISLAGILAFTYEFIRMYSSSRTRGVAMEGLKNSKRGLIIAGISSLVLFLGLLYFDIIYERQKDAELNETIKSTIDNAIDRQTQAIIDAIQKGGVNGNQSGNTTR
jgi:hypothetical protein